MRKNTQRTNRAFRVAYWAEVQRIGWTVSLTAFCHGWAMAIVGLLIPSAVTVLQFLASLNRAGKNGYLGCAVAYSLLAPRIAAATQRPCSVRTLERGLACLKALGLVQLHWWTIPDQQVSHGDHDVRIKGTARVETSDGWKCLQIRIVTLTDRAVALWDRATCGKGSELLPYYAPLLTPAKMADNPKPDQVVKPTMIDPVSTDDVNLQVKCDTVLDFEPNKDQGSPALTSTGQGRSTRPSPPKAAGQTFEHQTVYGTHEQDQQVESPDLQEALEKSLPLASDPCDHETQSFSPGPDTGKKDRIPNDSPRKRGNGVGPTSKQKGISHTPPKIPHTARRKTTWTIARAYLLGELAHCLREHSRREADAIYERARWELSGDFPAGWPTAVDWPYWVGRFGNFSQTQRRFHICRDILPLLKGKVAIVPSESHRFNSATIQRSKIAKIGADLQPFFKNLLDRFCGED